MELKEINSKETRLRELVGLHSQRCYDFVRWTILDTEAADDILVDVFRDFGERFRKIENEKREWKIPVHLYPYQITWLHLRKVLLKESFSFALDDHGKRFLGIDTNLSLKSSLDSEFDRKLFLYRLKGIDVEHRIPIILKDLLKFEDEEATQILGLRWGVYRHRLHRGRLELKELLKGSAKTSFTELKPGWAT